MISAKTFESAIAILQEYFGKQIQPVAAILVWRDYLSENLDDEELKQAVKTAIIECKFMPSPKELVEFVNGGKEAKAMQEWQAILRSAATNTQPSYLSNRGVVALQAVGGLRAIAIAEDSRRNQLERSFVTVYCQCSDKDARSLPQAQPMPPQAKEEVEASPVPEQLKRQMEELKAKMAMNKGGDRP